MTLISPAMPVRGRTGRKKKRKNPSPASFFYWNRQGHLMNWLSLPKIAVSHNTGQNVTPQRIREGFCIVLRELITADTERHKTPQKEAFQSPSRRVKLLKCDIDCNVRPGGLVSPSRQRARALLWPNTTWTKAQHTHKARGIQKGLCLGPADVRR